MLKSVVREWFLEQTDANLAKLRQDCNDTANQIMRTQASHLKFISDQHFKDMLLQGKLTKDDVLRLCSVNYVFDIYDGLRDLEALFDYKIAKSMAYHVPMSTFPINVYQPAIVPIDYKVATIINDLSMSLITECNSVATNNSNIMFSPINVCVQCPSFVMEIFMYLHAISI